MPFAKKHEKMAQTRANQEQLGETKTARRFTAMPLRLNVSKSSSPAFRSFDAEHRNGSGKEIRKVKDSAGIDDTFGANKNGHQGNDAHNQTVEASKKEIGPPSLLKAKRPDGDYGQRAKEAEENQCLRSQFHNAKNICPHASSIKGKKP